MNIPINEFFTTIQGEAKYTGTPSFFIRLQGCPVGCSFCDTKYTWDLHKEDQTKDLQEIIDKKNLNHGANQGTAKHILMDVNDVLKLCVKNSADHIVFTGGEPCMHDLTEITRDLNYFRPSGLKKRFTTQIETSGTYEIQCDPNTWVTLSPKINMSGGLDVLESSYTRADEIKYPVGKQKDIDNLLEILNNFILSDYVKIWLQPLSMSPKATQLCYDACLKYNFNLSLQTHKYANIR